MKRYLRCVLGAAALVCSACGAQPEESGGNTEAIAALAGPGSAATASEAAKIQALLDSRYPASAVHHSFHSKFGETIDCIDFFAQPGVKALAAAGPPLTKIPTMTAPPASAHPPQALADVAFTGEPDDQGNPRACGPNEVPMLRIEASQIQAMGGRDVFMANRTKRQKPFVPSSDPTAPDSAGAGYAHVQTDYTGPGPIQKGQATITPFPSYILFGNHAIGQTWLSSSDVSQTVEVGYNVDPWVNPGDQVNPHLFVYSTTTAYASGCYNNIGNCDGPFVLTPGALYTPGMTLAASGFGGSYQTLDLYTYFGSAGGSNAWIINNVGYYPASNFHSSMATGSAGIYRAGYEVYDASNQWVVPIGSGAEARAGYGQAAYVNFMEAWSPGGGWSASFNTIYSTVSAYGAWPSNGYYFAGNVPKVWWGQDYGDGFSPEGDWASGYNKGQCPNGHPVIGDSESETGTNSHAVLCGQQVLQTNGTACSPRNITNGDTRGYTDNGWDWQVGFIKDECAVNEYAQGMSQGQNSYIHGLLCCPGNVTHQSCDVQAFYASNSAAFGAGPDTDIGYFKGVCPQGQYVAGISQYPANGAAYSILCCSP
jgi:hypothetical protein